MVEMLGELIASILGLIKKGSYKQASEALEKAYINFLNEDAAFFRTIPTDKLSQKLIEEHNYTNGHLEILAELFATEAELQYAQNNKNACSEFSEKAIMLLEFLNKETKNYSLERNEKITLLKSRL